MKAPLRKSPQKKAAGFSVSKTGERAREIERADQRGERVCEMERVSYLEIRGAPVNKRVLFPICGCVIDVDVDVRVRTICNILRVNFCFLRFRKRRLFHGVAHHPLAGSGPGTMTQVSRTLAPGKRSISCFSNPFTVSH